MFFYLEIEMINFKPVQIQNEVITILKNLGSSISLKAGENVSAEVVDVLPSGAAVLRIKNGYITVNTEIPLSKDNQLLLKVLPPKDDKLQFQLILVSDKKPVNEVFLKEIPIELALKNLDNLPENIKSQFIQNLINNIIKLEENRLNLPVKDVYQIDEKMIKEAIQNSGSFFENKLATLVNQIENLKQMDLQAYKEIFDGKRNILENIDKMILENDQLRESLESLKKDLHSGVEVKDDILKQLNLQTFKDVLTIKEHVLEKVEKLISERQQLKEVLESIKNSLESIYSDAKVNIKDENVNSLIKSYQQLSLLSDSIFGVFPFVLNGIKISKYEIKKKFNENGNIIYFKGDIEFNDDTFVSYIIAKFYDGYYITIKSNDKNLVENLKELKKIAIERLKGSNINVVSFDVYG
jgi:uncharacterized protein YecA (UPF0149 family)